MQFLVWTVSSLSETTSFGQLQFRLDLIQSIAQLSADCYSLNYIYSNIFRLIVEGERHFSVVFAAIGIYMVIVDLALVLLYGGQFLTRSVVCQINYNSFR